MSDNVSFKVGDRIALDLSKYKHDQYGDNGLDCGEVIAPPAADPLSGKERVYIKLDSKWSKPNPVEVSADRLTAESKAKEKVSELEMEFNKLSDAASKNVVAARKLISEAVDMITKAGYTIYQVDGVGGNIRRIVDDCGWSSSSLSC